MGRFCYFCSETHKIRVMTTFALNNLWRYLQGLMLTQSEREWLAGKLSEPVKSEEKEEMNVESLKRHKVIPLSPDVEYLSSLHLREFTQEELDADPRLAAIMNDGRTKE